MSDRRYSTARWQRLRKAVLAHYGHVCQIQGPRCTGYATTVHHRSRARSSLSCSGSRRTSSPPAEPATTAEVPASKRTTAAAGWRSLSSSSSSSSRRSPGSSSVSPTTRTAAGSSGSGWSRGSTSRLIGTTKCEVMATPRRRRQTSRGGSGRQLLSDSETIDHSAEKVDGAVAGQSACHATRSARCARSTYAQKWFRSTVFALFGRDPLDGSSCHDRRGRGSKSRSSRAPERLVSAG
jgi:hypothetical protein